MSIITAFIGCGTVCLIGQMIFDNTKFTPGHVTSLFVVAGCFLDIGNIYDKFIDFAGAGAYLPITSFGHSMMDSVMKGIESDGLLGIPLSIFDSVSGGISSAILFAFLVAIIFKPKS